jgi:CBS domain-containing protein
MAKAVQDAMTPGVFAVEARDSLADAAQIMKREDVGSLPVVQDGRLLGMLTDRDIVVRAVAERIDPQSIKVGDVASREVVMVTPTQELDAALELMAEHQVRRLPVVEHSRVVGMIAQADIARDAGARKVGETVEAISEPG